jgi:hypothetical protein
MDMMYVFQRLALAKLPPMRARPFTKNPVLIPKGISPLNLFVQNLTFYPNVVRQTYYVYRNKTNDTELRAITRQSLE